MPRRLKCNKGERLFRGRLCFLFLFGRLVQVKFLDTVS